MFETFVVIFVVLLCTLIFKYSRKPSKFPPGPQRLPIFGSLPFLKLPIQSGLCELSKKYGPIFGVYFGNFPVVVLANATVARKALRDERFAGRPALKPIVERSSGVLRGLIFAEGDHWAEQRRFIMKTLKDFGFGNASMEAVINVEVAEFIERLRQDVGQSVKLDGRFNIAVLNALWNILSGMRYPHDAPKLSKILKLMIEVVDDNTSEGAFFFLPWLGKHFPYLSGYAQAMTKINATVKFVVEEVNEHKRTYDADHPRDFIDVYLQEIQRTTNPNSSFYKDVGEINLAMTIVDLVGAGSETTASTLTWAILFAVLNPKVNNKVYLEIESVIGISNQPSLSDRSRMPYMDAFISETLRMSSIAPIALFHSTVETVEINGYVIPKNTIVIPNLWQIHHDKKYWGDPDNFRPERFIDEQGCLRKDDGLLAFSTGKRICPGETLARDQIFLFLTGLFQQFIFEAGPKEPIVLKPTHGIVSKPGPFNTVIKLRKAEQQ